MRILHIYTSYIYIHTHTYVYVQAFLSSYNCNINNITHNNTYLPVISALVYTLSILHACMTKMAVQLAIQLTSIN